LNPNIITLSHPTYAGPSGATAAATYSFFTKDYKPPSQDRHLDYDVVHNQNGKFKWVFDNGPGFRRWSGFRISCQDAFESLFGVNAMTQFDHILEMWNYPGTLRMRAPDGLYDVHWAQDPQDQAFVRFPVEVATSFEMDVGVIFEEA
jgi:hypothetical protein